MKGLLLAFLLAAPARAGLYYDNLATSTSDTMRIGGVLYVNDKAAPQTPVITLRGDGGTVDATQFRGGGAGLTGVPSSATVVGMQADIAGKAPSSGISLSAITDPSDCGAGEAAYGKTGANWKCRGTNTTIGISSTCTAGQFMSTGTWVNGVLTGGGCVAVTSLVSGVSIFGTPVVGSLAQWQSPTSISSTTIGKTPTRQVLTSGTSATYTTPAGVRRICGRMTGGGGGGGTAWYGTNNVGATGGTTSFGTINAVGGTGGNYGNGWGNVGGAGGTGGTGTALVRIAGETGDRNYSYFQGGRGGLSMLGFPAGTCDSDTGGAGLSAPANSGAGGGGACHIYSTYAFGSGGGGGEYAEFCIDSPAATYTYTVGAGGNGGAGSSYNGGNGGSGIIIVDEFY